MKRAVVFLNGELSDTRMVKKLIKETDLIVGVDGGTKLILKLKFTPDLIIGDIDSLKELPKSAPLIKFPEEKDETDSQLALEYLTKLGYDSLVIVGSLGRRLDHLISNVLLFSQQKIEIQIIEGNQIIYFVKNSLIINGEKGDLVSLIPLQTNCQLVSTIGLKWELKNQTLKFGESLGISNVMTGKIVKIRLKSGLLILIHTKRL